MRKQKSTTDKLNQLRIIMHYLTAEQFQAQFDKIIAEYDASKKNN
tara:strand:+ start:711 stop:845 length:135 start_codon:yes stop_codon:yes gene_type:complete